MKHLHCDIFEKPEADDWNEGGMQGPFIIVRELGRIKLPIQCIYPSDVQNARDRSETHIAEEIDGTLRRNTNRD